MAKRDCKYRAKTTVGTAIQIISFSSVARFNIISIGLNKELVRGRA